MQKIIQKSIATVSAYGINLLSVAVASAAFGMETSKPTEVLGGDFKDNVVNIINYILGFLGLAAVAFVIYAGFLMVTAGGDDGALEKGKKIITYAAIGIVIILLSYTIVNALVGAGGNTGS